MTIARHSDPDELGEESMVIELFYSARFLIDGLFSSMSLIFRARVHPLIFFSYDIASIGLLKGAVSTSFCRLYREENE